MGIDIKLPIGIFFSILGFVVMLSGILKKGEVLEKLGFNFNLYWGIFIFIFGVIMVTLHFMFKRKNL